MKDDPKPRIDLSPERTMCSRHGEVFRARWPAGYPAFVLMGFERLMQDPAFQKETGGSTEAVGPALDRVPMCCRLTRPALLALYHQVHENLPVFVTAACENCRQVALGAPYSVTTRSKRVRQYGHICLDCVVNHMEPI